MFSKNINNHNKNQVFFENGQKVRHFVQYPPLFPRVYAEIQIERMKKRLFFARVYAEIQMFMRKFELRLCGKTRNRFYEAWIFFVSI